MVFLAKLAITRLLLTSLSYPIYGETNLAVDQNLIMMSIMKRVARKHGFRVLLHEKPFAGINGSGKHCNWSLGTDTGVGLLTPGKTPEENLQFITILVNILMAVYKNNALLKASIMTAQNAHRLGANEQTSCHHFRILGLSDF